jgi:hypothetical protein
MWSSLDRAKRRLRPTGPGPDEARGDAGVGPPERGTQDPPAGSPPSADPLVISVVRPELPAVTAVLERLAGPAHERPDTPARLAAAIDAAIDGWAGTGRVEVQRRPAGLYTPEAWEIRIADADARTRAGIDALLVEARSAWS